VLAPGANHIMLMGLTRDLKAGDNVDFTLNFTRGEAGAATSQSFSVLVKDYTGANEKYGSEHDEMQSGSMDGMGGEDHSEQ
ncbi:MAG: copper chaperone PCu(A)C, partial [Actinobacteria bacterium]|nr:copper chaperone PCu(A)C [Actinomycetota bacterium]